MFDTLADTFGLTGGPVIGLLFVAWWLPVQPVGPLARAGFVLARGWPLPG